MSTLFWYLLLAPLAPLRFEISPNARRGRDELALVAVFVASARLESFVVVFLWDSTIEDFPPLCVEKGVIDETSFSLLAGPIRRPGDETVDMMTHDRLELEPPLAVFLPIDSLYFVLWSISVDSG
jgi:hypothetical protein